MPKRLPRIKPERQSHSKSFKLGSEALRFTLLDYWQWSGSDRVHVRKVGDFAVGVLSEH